MVRLAAATTQPYRVSGQQMQAMMASGLALVGQVLPLQLNATFKGDGRDLSEAELIAIASGAGAGAAEPAASEDERRALH